MARIKKDDGVFFFRVFKWNMVFNSLDKSSKQKVDCFVDFRFSIQFYKLVYERRGWPGLIFEFIFELFILSFKVICETAFFETVLFILYNWIILKNISCLMEWAILSFYEGNQFFRSSFFFKLVNGSWNWLLMVARTSKLMRLIWVPDFCWSIWLIFLLGVLQAQNRVVSNERGLRSFISFLVVVYSF